MRAARWTSSGLDIGADFHRLVADDAIHRSANFRERQVTVGFRNGGSREPLRSTCSRQHLDFGTCREKGGLRALHIGVGPIAGGLGGLEGGLAGVSALANCCWRPKSDAACCASAWAAATGASAFAAGGVLGLDLPADADDGAFLCCELVEGACRARRKSPSSMVAIRSPALTLWSCPTASDFTYPDTFADRIVIVACT